MKQFFKMKFKVMLLILIILSIGMTSLWFYYGWFRQHQTYDSDKASLFLYQQMVILFSTIEYETDIQKKKYILMEQFKFDTIAVREKYIRSFNQLFDKQDKWYQFIMDSINFYIEKDKNITIKYYDPRAYEKRLNKFNENYLIEDIAKSQLQNYWKVAYFIKKDKKQSSRFFSQELYQDGKIQTRYFYQKRGFVKIKTENYFPSGDNIVHYFFRGRKIS